MISRRISKSGFPQLRSLHRANGFGGGAYGPPILSLTFFTLCMTKNRLSTRQSPAVDIAQYINRRMNAHAEMRGRFLSQRREPRAVPPRGRAALAREGAWQGESRAAACGGVPRAGAKAGQGQRPCTTEHSSVYRDYTEAPSCAMTRGELPK